MEFKEAMRIYNRICKEKTCCEGCVLDHKCPAFVDEYDRIAETEAILAKWAAAHPEKTIADDFFEKHPRAPKRSDSLTPMSCALDVGYVKCCPYDGDCAACWRRAMEEVEG